MVLALGETFDTSKITFGEKREAKGPHGKSCYVSIFYGGEPLRVKTPNEFYKVPLVMNNADREVKKEHLWFVDMFHKVVKKCK